jgi:3-hydroxy acid dehydrogenase / malonic semialdehyde reductase
MKGIEGKRILITGGTTGIGRATAIQLARDGAKVFIFGRHEKELRVALEAIQAEGEGEGMTADQSDHDQMLEVFSQAQEKLGGLDVVIANAALGAEEIGKMDHDDWRYIADVNFSGYLDVAKQALDAFGKNGGDIILVGSVSGEEPSEGESVYAATKAGIAGFASSLRKEVAKKNIRVSLIEPGAVDTDMQEEPKQEKEEKVRKAEMLRADDIADLVGFILTRPGRCTISEVRIEPRIAG